MENTILGNEKYKKVYISGPITGMKDLNKEEFEKYEIKFTNMGLTVVNPHKLHTEEEEQNNTWKQFMVKDIKALVECDFIVMLPNYENSKGANLEFYIARQLEMPILEAKTLKVMFYGK